jgi:outer membrane protein assembly factor BamE
MRFCSLFFVLISLFSLSNCASYDFSRRIVTQGNLLPEAKLQRLRLGMSKETVAILMGTSLVSPLFQQNRWDYAYTYKKGNGPLIVKRIVLTFHHGTLARIA